MHMPVIAGY